jgi:23S rRNA (guanosine2251-2'-O)-methyltransferase
VLLPRHRAAEVTPAVVRASAGAAAHLRVAQVTNLVRAMKEVQSAGYWTVGLDMAAPLAYHKVDVDRPLLLVVGSEGQGLGRLVRETCDYLIALPMRGRVASLNAATAGAIVLYDIRRRQQEVRGEG